MQGVTAARHPNLLIGFDTWDDAGVYRLSDDLALVQTVDFFTPIVDDPADFGAVAAANSLSDVYAMGGEPLTALGVVCFPNEQLPLEILSATLEGAQAVLREADVPLVGGHTVRDKEFKVGFAVTGKVHPDRIISNSGAQVGDQILLTKPLGTGILATAIKKDRLAPPRIAELVAVMRQLNRDAALAMVAAGTHAATDITGYGFAGHAAALARSSGVTLRIGFGAMPILAGALELLQDNVFPGGLKDNLRSLAAQIGGDIEQHPERRILFDPQTSGGMCVCLPPGAVETFQAEFARRTGAPAALIGEVVEQGDHSIEITD